MLKAPRAFANIRIRTGRNAANTGKARTVLQRAAALPRRHHHLDRFGVHFHEDAIRELTACFSQLARWSVNRQLDRAVEAQGEWKKVEESDAVRRVKVLRQQLVESSAVQEAKLRSLEEENKQLEKDLLLVAAPDTSAAFDFHNQLAATQLMLQIETGDASFRIGKLRDYLARNY